MGLHSQKIHVITHGVPILLNGQRSRFTFRHNNKSGSPSAMLFLYMRVSTHPITIQRCFSSSAFARHENPLVRSFRLYMSRSDQSRAYQDDLGHHRRCRAGAAQYRSGRCPMSRRCSPLLVAKEASARVPLPVSSNIVSSRVTLNS